MSSLSYNPELEERIQRYVNGRLNDSESDLLWAELIQNPYYFDFLKTAANLKELLREGEQKAKTIHIAGTIGKHKRYWMAVAASLALLIGVISVVLNSHSPATSLQPLQQLTFQNVRSAQIKSNTPSSEIHQAINFVNEGKEAQAMEIFQSLVKSGNDASIMSTAYIDMGIIHYNNKAFDQALEDFTNGANKADNNVLLKEKAYWYTGNTYLKMGRKLEARNAIQKAYDLNGAYRRVAGKYLEELNKELN